MTGLGSSSHLISEISSRMAAGEYAAAIPLLEKLYETDKQLAIVRNLGVCHYHCGAFDRALEWLDLADRLEPEDSGTVNNLAVISAKAGKLDIRAPHLLEPSTWNDVGLEAYYRGDWDAARSHIERAIELNPAYINAYYNISNLIPAEDAPAWISRLEKLQSDDDKEMAARAYALAELYSKLGDTRKIAQNWIEGAAWRKRSFDRQFDAGAHDKVARHFIEFFTKDRLARLRKEIAHAQPAGRRHIFVVGMPRSGSTLTARMIARDHEVSDLGEFTGVATGVIGAINQASGVLANISPQAFQQLYLSYCSQLPPTGTFLDKYPENLLHLGFIYATFPNLRIVHTQRERFDTLMSCFTHNFTVVNEWSFDTADTAAYFDTSMRLIDHWRKVIPEDVLMSIQYEDLARDPDTALKDLSAHCGTDYERAKLNRHSVGGRVETASAAQVREPVNTKAIGKYEKYRETIVFPDPAFQCEENKPD